MSVQFPFLMDTWEMGRCVHAYTGYIFKRLAKPTPAIKRSILIHPELFFTLQAQKYSTISFHKHDSKQPFAMSCSWSEHIKQSPTAELRITTFGQCLTHCPWRLSADFSIPFSPQPLWKYTELHCFPEDLHLPSTFPHHFWIISLIAFGD